MTRSQSEPQRVQGSQHKIQQETARLQKLGTFQDFLKEICSEDFKRRVKDLEQFDSFRASSLIDNHKLDEIFENFDLIKDNDTFWKYEQSKRNAFINKAKEFLLDICKLEALKEFGTIGRNSSFESQDRENQNNIIRSRIDELYGFISDIDNYKIKISLDKKVQDIHDLFQKGSENFQTTTTEALKKIEEEREKTSKEFQSKLDSAKDVAEGIKTTEGNIKKTLSEKSIKKASSFFSDQAKQYQKKSSYSLYAIFAVVVIIFILSYQILCGRLCDFFYNYCPIPLNIETTNTLLTEKSFIKFFLFSTLLSILYQLFKTYNAYSHQYVVNQHRYLSLETYLNDFAESGYGEEAKDKILIKTADTIFDIGDTGFIKTNNEKSKENYQITLSPTLKADNK